MKMQAEALEIAEVHTTALIIEGTTATPDLVNAITKGDCCAVPVEILRLGSSNGLHKRPVSGIIRMERQMHLHNHSNY